MLKAIVMDFDGVIVDTESEWYYIYREWLKADYGYDLRIEDYLVCVGANNEALFRFLENEIEEPLCKDQFLAGAEQGFRRRTADLPAMDGVVEFVREAKSYGLKLAIATSATIAKPRYHLERLGIMDAFDEFSTAELFEHIKPAPDAFLKAAELLGCEPRECLAVEDSGNGLESARRAGMPCLIIPNQITASCEFKGYYKKADSLRSVRVKELIIDFRQM